MLRREPILNHRVGPKSPHKRPRKREAGAFGTHGAWRGGPLADGLLSQTSSQGPWGVGCT